MKKLIIAITLACTPISTFAVVATLPLQVLQNATAVIQNATALIGNVTSEITKYATLAMKIKQFIDDPMMALVGANTGKQIESETRKWLAGGIQGDPLLIINPEAYLKNTQTNALRRQIALIEASKNRSPWSESLITNLIKQRRAEVNPGSAAVKDPSASIVQNSLCENGGTSLQNMVEEQSGIQQLGTGSSRFDELYNELCRGDPSSDPELQKQLTAISQSKDYFSWDSWLSTTGGNSQYALKTRSEIEIARRTAEALALAEKESATGYLPDRKCVEYTTDETDENGTVLDKEYQKCIAWETRKAGETVAGIAEQLDINTLLKPLFTAAGQKPLADHALSGLGDMFKGIQEAVAGAQQIASQVAQTGQAIGNAIGAINTLTGTVQYAGTALGSGKNANTSQINLLGTARTSYSNPTYVGYNRSTVSTSTQISDGSTPEQLEDTIRPLRDLLNDHKVAMTKLPTIVGKIDSSVNQYQNFIQGVVSCTQDITSNPNFNASSDQNRVFDFENRLETKRIEFLDPITIPLAFVKNKTNSTNTYLANTLATVTNSKNISSVLALYQSYKDSMSNQVILPSDIDMRLDTIFKQQVPELDKDMSGISDEVNNNSSLKRILDECATLLNEVNARSGGSPQNGG